MDFTVDLAARPEAIVVRVGDARFRLLHGYMTAHERARVCDGIALGIETAMAIAAEKIDAWEGVRGPDGVALPLTVRKSDGTTTSNLAAVLGRVPFVEQMSIFFRQMAANGTRFARLAELVRPFIGDDAKVAEFVAEIEDFFSARGSVPGMPSASSSAGATSPPPSA